MSLQLAQNVPCTRLASECCPPIANAKKLLLRLETLKNNNLIRMKNLLAPITLGFTFLMGATAANAIPLYRGLKTPSETPSQQGWVYQNTPFPAAPTATPTSNGTILNSGNIQNYAGYFLNAPFNLDRTRGYTVSFSVQINSESHVKDNRAGFSLIVMSNQLDGETQPYGLELGFWEDSIWAQSADFARAENVAFNTKDTVHHFVLYVKGNQYKLFERNSYATPILQGSLRQYTAFTPPPGFPNPYTTPNLIFMGDDTTSATANVTITRVYASPLRPTP